MIRESMVLIALELTLWSKPPPDLYWIVSVVFLGDIPRVRVFSRRVGSTVNLLKLFFPYKGNASSEGSGTISPSKVPASPFPNLSVVKPVRVVVSFTNL